MDIPMDAGFLCDRAGVLDAAVKRKDRQWTYSATLTLIHVTFISLEEQYILNILSVSLSLVAQRVKRMRHMTLSYVAHLAPSRFPYFIKNFQSSLLIRYYLPFLWMLLYSTNRQSATLLTNSTADAKAFLYICSPRVTKYINYLVLWLVWSYESFNVLNKHKVSNSTLKKAENIYKTLTVSKSTVPQLKLTQPLKGKISFTKGHFTKIFLFKLNTTNERCFYLWQAEGC